MKDEANHETPPPGAFEEPAVTRQGLDDGDVGLIRWMLELSPTERLEQARDFLEGALALRHGRKITR